MNQVKAGAVLNYVIIGLNTLTGLLYTPYMLRCLGQNEYGLYSLVASVIAYLTLLDFGFGSAIVRFTARVRAIGKSEEEWSLYGMFLAGYAALGVVVTIAGLALYFNVDRLFDSTMTGEELRQARIMMALMVANLAVTFPFSVFGSIITAYEKFVFQRTLSIMRILLSTIVLVAVLSMGYKAIALVVVQTVFSIATLAANVFYCRYRLKIKIWFHNFSKPLFKEIMVFSWWNFLGAIVDRIYWSTGQFILGMYCGTAEVAIFSVGIMMTNLYMSMSTAFNSVLLPRITSLVAKQSNDKEISNLFIKTGRVQFGILALIVSGFIVFGRPFIALWAGSDYGESYIITIIFFVALICPLIQNVGITILLAKGEQKFRSLLYLAIAVASVLCQIFVSKNYGAVGCATVIAITLFIGQWLIMNVYYSKKQHIAIGEFWKQILSMSAVPALFCVVGGCSVRHLGLHSWFSLAVGVTCYLILYCLIFYKYSFNAYEKNQILIPLRKLIGNIR